MAQNYYYLVTGLPDLIEGGGKGFSYEKIRQEIIDELIPEDIALLKLLLLQFDNANIVNILNKKPIFDSKYAFTATSFAAFKTSPKFSENARIAKL